MTAPAEFRAALAAGRPLVGTFVRAAVPEMTEFLAPAGLDFLCYDTEHGIFDRRSLDTCLLAARACAVPSLVRVQALEAPAILQALDMGASGVLAPHVRSPEDAAALARMSRYGRGGRGYAGSCRAGAYSTKPMARHLADSAAQVAVVAQIEDAEAIEDIDAIMAVEGIDAFFVGRADLTVSLGAASPAAPEVDAAVRTVCAAARRAGRPLGLFLADGAEVAKWRAEGASFFIIGSDVGLARAGAKSVVEAFAAMDREAR